MARPAERRPDLHIALASDDPIAATNAAILLARDGETAALDGLLRACESQQIRILQRCAAAEALADIGGPEVVGHLRKLADYFGKSSDAADSHSVPPLHAELLRSLAYAEIAAAKDTSTVVLHEPRFAAALDSASPAVRREAVLALGSERFGPLPDKVRRLANDMNSKVRQAALIVLAARRHPEACDLLRQALLDQDLGVRETAIAGLGRLGTPEASAELRRAATRGGDQIRAAAVGALGDLGESESVATAAGDKSWHVRLVVAQWLAHDPDPQTVKLAERLILDPKIDVALQAIGAVGYWPLEQAGPVLMTAMEGRSYLPRKVAAEQLAQQWPPAADFEPEANAERRKAALIALRQRWEERPGESRASATAAANPRPAVRDESAGDLAAVERLNVAEVPNRRQAAEALRAETLQRPLSSAALARLVDLMADETDPLVWTKILTALAADDREPSLRIACKALEQTAPEVRRRACEHLAAHPDPRNQSLLLAALADPNPPVVAAAIHALGQLPALDDPRPLEHVLDASDHRLRVDAAEALARLGKPSGPPALERLALDPDWKVRRATALAMGTIHAPSFLPALIQLLDDRPEIRHAALESLPPVAGRDTPPAVKGGSTPSADPETPQSQAQRWKEWYHQQATIR